MLAPNLRKGGQKVIVALSRYGGLRCPSEVLSLRWEGIDWQRNRIVVESPRTAHHPGRDRRVIPLFTELRPILEEAYCPPHLCSRLS